MANCNSFCLSYAHWHYVLPCKQQQITKTTICISKTFFHHFKNIWRKKRELEYIQMMQITPMACVYLPQVQIAVQMQQKKESHANALHSSKKIMSQMSN